MGTRNLTCVVLNGKYVVAQYGQWDGYPSGQGLTVLAFARDQMDRERFEMALANCSFISKEALTTLWQSFGADAQGFVSIEGADKFAAHYPALSRDTAAKVLTLIQDSQARLLKDDLLFAADSVFCEYAYVLDLDKNVLEVYKGFNDTPLAPEDRFSFLDVAQPAHRGDKYYPVKFLASFPLDALPTDSEFCGTCEPLEAEVED